MDPVLQAALATSAPTIAHAVKIALTGGDTIRLCDGGEVVIDSETYTGRDATYGVLGPVEPVSDGVEGQAMRCTITVLPPTGSALADITDPLVQDSPVTVWQLAVDPDTGALIGEPELLFQGELDFCELTVADSWALAIECGTQEGRLLEVNDEQRLTHSFHDSIWPDELGLEYVGLDFTIYWRVAGSSGAIVKGGGGTSTNSGGGRRAGDSVMQ